MASGTTSRRGLTAFDYVSDVLPDQGDLVGGTTVPRVTGGGVQPYVAGTATPVWGQVAGIDTTADNQVVIQGTSNIQRAVGIFVGQQGLSGPVFGSNCYATEMGAITAGSTKLYVQIRGKAYAYADGVITRGDLVTASTTTAGYVTSNNSASAGQILGKALTSTTTSGDQVLIVFQRG